MNIEAKKSRLFALYDKYAELARPFFASAVCEKGCADCCTSVGRVDIVTLEGMIILKQLKSLDAAVQKEVQKRLKQNRKTKRESKFARCAFLLADNSCMIYPVRPFSCRRLYSIQRCGTTGPTVHRQAWEAAEQVQLAIRQLDSSGCMGHMSYILQLLSDARFLKFYVTDQLSPQNIPNFAANLGISANRPARPLTPP
ncbi:YkgJ family cysteine cluster protein [Desulfoferrobacter suflitae]|uniref:YkgJ family cysteine cluster protein n=1 Tax=Desulfoferrobacter suflitae TaxID=2865782 RepID=UPI002164DC21|nr:YkgJ family cysteine cluster protein [Desulfoferrobacter suflitae]MCK8602310.1 YkgJ family cysteine cluster protein [Desulfoferrobacter suflitae]